MQRGALTRLSSSKLLGFDLKRICAEHYADDLGMDLEDSFESDFNAKLEDGSPYEVSR